MLWLTWTVSVGRGRVGVVSEPQHGGHPAADGDGRDRRPQAAHAHAGQQGVIHPHMAGIGEQGVLLVGGEGGVAGVEQVGRRPQGAPGAEGRGRGRRGRGVRL